ncbi:MAG: acyl-CoA thioesterase [Solirubrobacterales bacterium]|nr:acyl-CoA thioesterase [Solirubrobacterales bacterium]
MARPFIHRLRVRYAECDMQGVVFNSHYLVYFDAALTELWREALGGYRLMLDQDIDLVVAEAHLRYKSAARFEDELTVEMTITHLGETSIVSEYSIGCDGTPLVDGMTRHVTVSRDTLKKTPIPGWMRSGLEPWVSSGR